MDQKENSHNNKITDPNDYLAFKHPDVEEPPGIRYILLTELHKIMKTGYIPNDPRDFLTTTINLYKNTNGKYTVTLGVVGSSIMFLPEILEYMQKDEDFIKRCIEEGKTAFLPQDVTDMFIF